MRWSMSRKKEGGYELYFRHAWKDATEGAMRFIKAQGHDIDIVPEDPKLKAQYEKGPKVKDYV